MERGTNGNFIFCGVFSCIKKCDWLGLGSHRNFTVFFKFDADGQTLQKTEVKKQMGQTLVSSYQCLFI